MPEAVSSECSRIAKLDRASHEQSAEVVVWSDHFARVGVDLVIRKSGLELLRPQHEPDTHGDDLVAIEIRGARVDVAGCDAERRIRNAIAVGIVDRVDDAVAVIVAVVNAELYLKILD